MRKAVVWLDRKINAKAEGLAVLDVESSREEHALRERQLRGLSYTQ